VFFKTFLVLAQKEPNIVATSDILNIEDLLKQIEKKKKEAVLMLKKGGEVNFFYFRNGKLSEGYFENPVEIKKEDAIADQLLVYTYSSGESDPMEVQVYYDLEVSPAVDVEDASLALKEGVEHRLATRPRLVLKQGGKELEKVVDKGVFTLGRDLRSDWTLKDPMVSREHAIIKQNADGFYIEDRGSRNGTFVNKEKITGKKLSNGDEIQIGSCLFYFVEKEGEAKVALSSSAPEERALKEKETVRSQSNGPPLSEWSLEVVEGKEPGKAFKLPAKRLSMGRGKVDIIIDDPKVSRHHADLEWTEKGFVLNDLNSTNGVFVNDVKIDKKLLSAGDIIMVGAARLRIVRQK
ncbi:MAG TPA: FHA domain-containing protein, partial [Candidatus Manganitrophaceae bacterium]